MRAPGGALERLPAAAAFHRTVGFVFDEIGSELPSKTAGELEHLQREERARHLIVSGTLRRVRECLLGAGVPFLVVKGPVLAALAYSSPRLRSYRDLDLIVPRSRFADALQAFESEGANVIDPNWRYLFDEVAGEVELTTGVDLHWHFLFSESVRRATKVRMEEIFERARRATVGGMEILTPDAPDTLIHLALHACKEGGDRLIWLKDIEQAVLNDKPPWRDVVDRALDWRVNLFVGAILLRARRVLHAPVPDEVLGALIPNRPWRRLLHSLDVLFPIDIWTGCETPATIAVRATRADAPRTLEFIGRAALSRARNGVRSGARPAGRFTATAEARTAFLDRIASGR